ncbi:MULTISPECIES: RNA polymerase sigma factor [Flavobacterium]|uniref:Sigma-70 family RNA polymerase sigma factor n=1 Tax=Flavobacterium ranwuense TaxID=2541725 RepID=A0ABY2DPH6_9FLAO|nr:MULTISPECIES: sigma-70 family RNA polymerase sigma factor [Flavobacterium]TDE28216.1 sigma-70 family RNA polymerase sigma factor [Flavobacterium ranwuense]TDE49076.1 sigma-70 family RNA polymerase sigma factor [Flavobacterium sp. GT3P67]
MDNKESISDQLPDEEILFSLMDRYYNELFRYGVKFTADVEMTKDALNQFFIHLWDNRDKLQHVDNLKAYLFVSYKRWLITHLQRSQKHRVLSLDDNHANELSEQSYEEYLVKQIEEEKIAQILKNAIKSLPARQRQLLQLRFYEHMSFEEIAEETSLSVRTVYNKLHEAIKRLRVHQPIERLR